MTANDNYADNDARLAALPRVILGGDWLSAAIIVESFTGVAYAFDPSEGAPGEPTMLLEGFMLPVQIDQPEETMESPEALLEHVSYRHPAADDQLHPVFDSDRDLVMHNTIPVLTAYGPGMFLWNFGDYPQIDEA